MTQREFWAQIFTKMQDTRLVVHRDFFTLHPQFTPANFDPYANYYEIYLSAAQLEELHGLLQSVWGIDMLEVHNAR